MLGRNRLSEGKAVEAMPLAAWAAPFFPVKDFRLLRPPPGGTVSGCRVNAAALTEEGASRCLGRMVILQSGNAGEECGILMYARGYIAQGGRIFALLLCVCVTWWLPGATVALAGPRLWGTVEFQMPLTNQKNWLAAIERNRQNPIFFDEKRLNASMLWKDLRRRLQGKPFLEQLADVNRFWNVWPYRTDREAYGKSDYWAAPAEFLARSGDCEDYCIAKYYTLKELGIPVDAMRIVVVRDTIRQLGHAILAVYHGETIYLLDNLSDAVRPSQRVRNYAPQFSVNEKHRWVHVKPR